MFLIGFACCYQVLVFTIGSSIVKPEFIGVTVAFLNFINMLGGSFFHSIIGFTMDHLWSGNMRDGMKIYDATSYNYSLLVIPIAAFVGACIFLFLGLSLLRKSKYSFRSNGNVLYKHRRFF